MLITFRLEVSVRKSEIMTLPLGRPMVIDLQSADLPHTTLVRLQTHHSILATHYICFYFCFPKMSLMEGKFKL